jgi:hypothetical protein
MSNTHLVPISWQVGTGVSFSAHGFGSAPMQHRTANEMLKPAGRSVSLQPMASSPTTTVPAMEPLKRGGALWLGLKPAELSVMLLASAFVLAASYRNWWSIGVAEAWGFVTGGVCVWLVVREHMWNWPVGLANNLFFFVLFLRGVPHHVPGRCPGMVAQYETGSERPMKHGLGLAIGKFYRPHRGHILLIDTATQLSELTVVIVCAKPCA